MNRTCHGGGHAPTWGAALGAAQLGAGVRPLARRQPTGAIAPFLTSESEKRSSASID
jgi:hypothetical protein